MVCWLIWSQTRGVRTVLLLPAPFDSNPASTAVHQTWARCDPPQVAVLLVVVVVVVVVVQAAAAPMVAVPIAGPHCSIALKMTLVTVVGHLSVDWATEWKTELTRKAVGRNCSCAWRPVSFQGRHSQLRTGWSSGGHASRSQTAIGIRSVPRRGEAEIGTAGGLSGS